MSESSTRFRVWSVHGTPPQWEADLGIVRVEKSIENVWIVYVSDGGAKLERYIKSRSDLFVLYERMAAALRTR
jgi:hypothetical protein